MSKKAKKLLKKGHMLAAIAADMHIDVSKLKSYADLAVDIPPHGLDGINVPIADILNISIVVVDYKDDLQSKFKDDQGEPMQYTVIQFFFADDPTQQLRVVNTASRVLREKLMLCKDSMPFVAKIIKSNKHYRFV